MSGSTTGKVVHFDSSRGFGFLAPEDGGADVFLHVNDMSIDETLLQPGVEVSFDVETTDRGAKAVNVAFVGEPPAARPIRRDEERRERGDRGDRGDRRDRGDRDRGDRRDRDRGGDRDRGRGRTFGRTDGPMAEAEFTEELTEMLLDSSPTLTAAQILAIRQRVAGFAVARGWVHD